jgi:glycosyltransferase involved in cell wall biosynthesis
LVIGLLDDPERCRSIGARNRDRAQSLFSRESMVEAYRSVYREVLQAPR